MEKERLISLKEAAALYRMSHSHLRLLAREGKIWAKKIGRDWLTTREAVAAYAENEELRRRGPRKKRSD